MSLTQLDIPTHEAVYRLDDAKTGLTAFTAIHSTKRGPAAGGLRMRTYPNADAALKDVLLLSEGITFKNAAAGLPLGGGKAVIIGDHKVDKSPQMLEAVGRAIQSLSGAYWTAEDMGMTPDDMAVLSGTTNYVAGLPSGTTGSGDPSPVTARGVLNGIKTALRHKVGTSEVAGRSVAVQGLGNVGWSLCELLTAAGATLIVADTDLERLKAAEDAFAAQVAPTGKIHSNADADVFAPCAIGGILNTRTVEYCAASIIAGATNNQLANSGCADRLHIRDKLYAPDFVVNGGGIINVAAEILNVEEPSSWVDARLMALDQTLDEILTLANATNLSPHRVAIEVVSHKL